MKTHQQQLPGLSKPFTMIAVEGGVFDMGGENWLNNALPIHPVDLDAFWIGAFPVTQALWMAIMGDNNPSFFKGHNRPVEGVSWDMICREFLPGLNKRTAGNRPTRTEYRLPTEAEWEYAARGGVHWKEEPFIYSGSDILDEVGWYNENSHGEMKPPGLKLPNQLGLYDMSGNVLEWCADWYDSRYYQKCLDHGIVKNPTGPAKGFDRVHRGGGWLDIPLSCSSTNRSYSRSAGRGSGTGFRLVLFSSPV